MASEYEEQRHIRLLVVSHTMCTETSVKTLKNSQDIPHGRVRRQACSAGWSDVAGLCVIYGDTPKNWWMAHLDCIERGGYLATKDDMNISLQAVTCPTGSISDADEEFCYELTNVAGTLHEAEEYCQSKGGSVPTESTDEEIRFILDSAKNIQQPSASSNGLWILPNRNSSGAWFDLPTEQADTDTDADQDTDAEPPTESPAAGLGNCTVINYDDTSSPAGYYGKIHYVNCNDSNNIIMCRHNAGAWVGALWVVTGVQFLDGIYANPTWAPGVSQLDKCAFELSDGHWDTDVCTTLRPYVCREGSPPTLDDSIVDAIIPRISEDNIACPIDDAPSDSFYNPDTHACYWFTATAHQDSALDECNTVTGHAANLAVIDDAKEGNYIFTKMLQSIPDDFIWIGLEYVSAKWVDVNGNQPSYTQWENEKNESACAVMARSVHGRWESFSCKLTFPGVCELKDITVPEPTIMPEVTPHSTPYHGISDNEEVELILENIRHSVVTSNTNMDHQTISDILIKVTTLLQDYAQQLSSTTITYLLNIATAIAEINSVSADMFEQLVYICDYVLRENNQETLLMNVTLLEDLTSETFNSFIYSVSFARDDGLVGDFVTYFVTFYFQKMKDPGNFQRCAFWDPEISEWSVAGCQLDEGASNTTHSVCHCNHLTNFAILMQFNEPIDLGVHDDVLEYLTYIGTSISVLCLVITLLIYLLGKLLKSERIIVHSNLALALLIGQVIFISGVDATSNSSMCTTIAVLLHYFFLATFSWMLVEGIHLYMKSTMAFAKQVKTWMYLLLGWGLPAVVVGITFGVRHDGYGVEGSGKCWLSTEAGLSWAFIGPVLAIILINTVILILVIRVFMTLKANADKSEAQRIRTGIRAILMLQPLLGISWLFGLFSVNKHTIVFQYLFVLCNSLQGLFIFICHCLTNDEVRAIFLKKYRRMASSSIHTSSFNTASSTLAESTQTSAVANRKSSSNKKQAWK
ncbi:uncharacterized protein LOC144341642 [Saccoglossus kowalevskii]